MDREYRSSRGFDVPRAHALIRARARAPPLPGRRGGGLRSRIYPLKTRGESSSSSSLPRPGAIERKHPRRVERLLRARAQLRRDRNLLSRTREHTIYNAIRPRRREVSEGRRSIFSEREGRKRERGGRKRKRKKDAVVLASLADRSTVAGASRYTARIVNTIEPAFPFSPARAKLPLRERKTYRRLAFFSTRGR